MNDHDHDKDERGLVAFVMRVSYLPVARLGIIRLIPGNKADMSGSIELMKRLDPDVKAIELWSDNQAINRYELQENGEWISWPNKEY